MPPHKHASGHQAIRYEVFNDLLIGNFTKTPLIGGWLAPSVHPFFTPVIAK